MKRNETMLLGEVMRQYFDEEPDLHEHLLEMRTLELLPSVLGSLYKYVGKAHVQDAVLYLQVYSASFKHSLHEGREVLRQRLNEELGIELLREVRLR
ncbi:MAG: DciA family protein [Porphyromonadaceae bacterium]|nr:DciA family protein [Porphyromonadaceae bacterium]